MDEEIIQEIPLDDILVDEDFNCRGKITPQSVIELGQDIELNGLTQPVIVMKLEEPIENKKVKLIIGFRRMKAHVIMSMTTIKCIMKETMSLDRQIILNLSENLQRKDLTILEEAISLQPLKRMGYTQTAVMDALNKKRGWVQTRMMLLDLPKDIQQEAANGILTHQHIRDLYSMDNEEDMYSAVRKIKDHVLLGRGKSSVNLNPTRKKKSINQKKARNKTEIFITMALIQDQCRNSMITRTLAWCAGEISDLDFYTEVRRYYEDQESQDFNLPPELMAQALNVL